MKALNLSTIDEKHVSATTIKANCYWTFDPSSNASAKRCKKPESTFVEEKTAEVSTPIASKLSADEVSALYPLALAELAEENDELAEKRAIIEYYSAKYKSNVRSALIAPVSVKSPDKLLAGYLTLVKAGRMAQATYDAIAAAMESDALLSEDSDSE